jgi:hypothetical protein
MLLDRASGFVTAVGSTEGGMDTSLTASAVQAEARRRSRIPRCYLHFMKVPPVPSVWTLIGPLYCRYTIHSRA